MQLNCSLKSFTVGLFFIFTKEWLKIDLFLQSILMFPCTYFVYTSLNHAKICNIYSFILFFLGGGGGREFISYNNGNLYSQTWMCFKNYNIKILIWFLERFRRQTSDEREDYNPPKLAIQKTDCLISYFSSVNYTTAYNLV